MDLAWTRLAFGDEQEANSNAIMERCFTMLESLEVNPIQEFDHYSFKRKGYINRLWNEWLEYMKCLDIAPDQVWIDHCLGKDKSKDVCRTFLYRHVLKSEVWRPCLGPKLWHKVRKINAAITLEDVWAGLVKSADLQVLKQKRQENPKEATFWELRFSSRENTTRRGPAYEVAQYILVLAKQLGLTLKQTFVKREARPENIILILDTFWRRGEDISIAPQKVVPSSVIQIKYKDVELAWLRDPKDSSKAWLVATITIHHTIQREDRIKRSQRESLKFTIALVPCNQLCLLTFLVSRAIVDDAFHAGFTSPQQIICPKALDANVDYVPLRWKPEIMDKYILWNRILFVSGVRGGDEMRPYSMRVGAGGRLDGSLTAPLRNFILSNSTEVYEKSYLPVHLSKNLMRVAYGNRVGQNDEVISLMGRVLMRRDPDAPIYLEREDIKALEGRLDILAFREEQKKAKLSGDTLRRLHINQKIKYELEFLEKLRLKEKRKAYFETVDALRVKGQPTDHLSYRGQKNLRKHRSAVGAPVAMKIGKLVKQEGTSHDTIIEKISLYITDRPLEKLIRCLLCNYHYFSKSNLSRHVLMKHEILICQPFSCPECRRSGSTHEVVGGPSAWSHHVAKVHDEEYAPNPRKSPPRTPAFCPLCEKSFKINGYNQHYHQAHLPKMSFPFNCPECKRLNENVDYAVESADGWLIHIRDHHNSKGGNRKALGAIITQEPRSKRSYTPSETKDCNQKSKRVRRE
ncbi:hypothetical protein V8C35DRAFT_332508 [Trichoderma chlorosporum]